MTKDSKSAATIRRRRTRPLLTKLLSKVRENQHADTARGTEDVIFYKEVLRSTLIEKIMSSEKTLFMGLLVIRLVNSLLIQTSFVPDEYWQSVEVAHNMAYGYGYLTWEWKVGIRSYSYPFLFASFFKLLEVFGLDSRILLIRGPRLLQGVIASVGDLYLYFLSCRLAGQEVAKWTLLCQLLSWFMGYCFTRTLSNTTESVLVTAALFYFPWPKTHQPKGYSRRFVLLAALSVVVRPTAAVLWILLSAWHLQLSKGTALFGVLRLYITTGLTVLAVSTAVDSFWYGRWILVHLNFLKFNVLSGGSQFYGSHPWHWYLTQGLPVVLGAHSLPFVLGAWRAQNKVLLFLMAWKVFVLSFLAHKEFRFLLPVMPMAMHYCGVYFHSALKPPSHTPTAKAARRPVKGASDTTAAEASPEDKTEVEAQAYRESAHLGPAAVYDRPDLGQNREKEQLPSTSKCLEKNSVFSTEGCKPKNCDDKNGVFGPARDTGQKFGSKDCKAKGDFSSADGTLEGSPRGLQDEKDEKSKMENDAGERYRARKVRLLLILLAITNFLPLLYFSLIHQRGTVDVMNFLHDSALQGVRKSSQAHTSSSSFSPSSAPSWSLPAVTDSYILFLMPCHSTPFYSYIHANVSMRFLTCEPNLDHVENYMDEADVFYSNPAEWLKAEYQIDGVKLPTHVVYFNVLQDSIQYFLTLGGYRPCARFFHTQLPEGRVGSHVLVSCR